MEVSDEISEIALKLSNIVPKKTLSAQLQVARKKDSLDLQAVVKRVSQKERSRCKYQRNLLFSNKVKNPRDRPIRESELKQIKPTNEQKANRHKELDMQNVVSRQEEKEKPSNKAK